MMKISFIMTNTLTDSIKTLIDNTIPTFKNPC